MTQLIRFSPTGDARRMQTEFDRLFGSLFPTTRAEDPEAETAVWAPRVDLVENDEAYLIHADLPGLSKDDVNVNFHDGVLSISGDRKSEQYEEKDNCVRLERAYGRFYRSFTLPTTMNDKAIEAGYENGVLTVRVPKAEESKPRRIAIS
jgi:HSP20 family protein